MSISGYGRLGFNAWDKKRRTLFNLHRSLAKNTYNQTSKIVWGDWFWLAAGTVVVPSSGRNLSFRHSVSPSKLVGETITLYFNFTDQVTFGESLSSPVCTVQVVSGTDSQPEDIVLNAAVVEGAYVSQKITAGLPGVIYAVTCSLGGEDSHLYQVTTRLAVLPDTGSFGAPIGLSIEGILPDTFAYSAYYELLDIIGGYSPYGPVTVFSGNYPIGFTPTVVARNIVTSGIANDTGTFTFVYKLVDFAGNIAYSAQEIYIPPVDLYGAIPTVGFVGVAYAGNYDAQYGMPPYTFSIFSGTIIAGVSLNASTCYFTGTPTTAGTYTFETGVTDDIAETDSIEETVIIYIGMAPKLVCSSLAYGGASLGALSDNGQNGSGSSVGVPAGTGIPGLIASSGPSIAYRVSPTTGAFGAITINGTYSEDSGTFSLNGEWMITSSYVATTSITYRVYQKTGTSFTLFSTLTQTANIGSIRSIVISPDGTKVLSLYVTDPGTYYTVAILAFDEDTGTLTANSARYYGPSSFASNAAWCAGSTTFVFAWSRPAPDTGGMRLLDTNFNLLSTSSEGMTGNRFALAVSKDGRFVYSTGPYNGGTANIGIHSITGSTLAFVASDTSCSTLISCADVSPDGLYLAVAHYDTAGDILTYSINQTTGLLTASQQLEGNNDRNCTWIKYS